MSRRYTTTRAMGLTDSTTSRWISPKGTKWRREKYCHWVSRPTSSRTLRMEASGRYGTLWKWTKRTRQPRFIMRQAATGESMPPEMRAATVPAEPTGSPPGPGQRSGYTKAWWGSTSTWISRAAWWRSTRASGRLARTCAPSSRLRSVDVSGKVLNARLRPSREDVGAQLAIEIGGRQREGLERAPRRDAKGGEGLAVDDMINRG